MVIERVDYEKEWNNGGIQLTSMPQKVEKFHIEVTEKELMEAVGRSAVSFFNLLNQAMPKPSPLTGVVILREKDETPAVETKVEEIAEEELNTLLEEADSFIPIPEKYVQEVEKIRQTPEHIKQMIETYSDQIRLLAQSMAQEKKLLETQEKIQALQNMNRQRDQVAASTQLKDCLSCIASYQREIDTAREEIEKLKQNLQDKPT